MVEIADVCKQVGTESLNLVSDIKSVKSKEEIQGRCESVKKKVNEVAGLVEELTKALKKDTIDILEDLVEGELVAMEKAIEQAAERIEVRPQGYPYQILND